METTTLLLGLLLGLLIGITIAYFVLKASYIPRRELEKQRTDLIQTKAELQSAQQQLSQYQQSLRENKDELQQQSDELGRALQQAAGLEATKRALEQTLKDSRESELQFKAESNRKELQLQELIATNADLSAKHDAVQSLLERQKKEIEKLQEAAELQFENLANRILEEKTSKFTAQNTLQLKTILEPFQEKITELKNKVSETYDRESKERFSLGEKVRELASLNQQISQDAKNLTRALKGESKTQGRWGEMILESILEKSGLSKGREYFLEQQLTDRNNQALYSQYSGKKMRPDAIIKYPDDRNVIIDSKVSLTAFAELTEDLQPEQYKVKLNAHLASVKQHIMQLSQKAYDDYDKSLDFVMMFIPSEPAYIAAMQADPNLWNFAYEKRILLLNPSNLITSLKLISDLWKREAQNQNSLEIADRGAKLYDKFVSFVENLEKVGKNLDTARSAYDEAYKQLYTGKDNLIRQTQRMKQLGLKPKKNVPQNLIDLDAADTETPLLP
ncbi:DNA recombination protein RmuC [Planobacterium oryzisoli]|uniref:DNA recombination protein RmuC n=1 Tax=Planobacterium oryzisoli TaxID=2771435 RepID=A0A931E533_9FLAO|nr:DNA recombination protein RmuC [Planobacterium oryzisoli]MBF5026810.1 DNA recombination protein RmuC [Planobacterium oryzisoli]